MSVKGYLKYLGVILIGAALGSALFYVVTSYASLVPSGHQGIVNSITIFDQGGGVDLTPKFVVGGTETWGALSMATVDFAPNSNYQESTWIWQRHGDTEFVLKIWGPDSSGRHYLLEFGRSYPNPCLIKINGQTVFTTSQVTTNTGQPVSGEGYYNYVVTA